MSKIKCRRQVLVLEILASRGCESSDASHFSSLEECDVLSVAKVPWAHGVEAPGEPHVAAHNFLPFRRIPFQTTAHVVRSR